MRHTTRPFTRLAAILFTLGLVFAACGDDGGDDAAPAEDDPSGTSDETSDDGGDEGGDAVASDTVEIVDFTYNPETVTVAAGSELTFTNSDGQAHTATSSDTGVFDTDSVGGGESATVTVDEPGEYAYFCAFHPFMKGTVVVD